ncbi:LCP family protein [Clostridium omnivorum]|uniref:LytR family transcriptional regulator n=1 Tax=Clostridium omnivorum TaxID=1604902 RepID=A0ABQ5N3A5_9CLOT|nr:LCP family protein [Clostridium sp. E14]GLC29697.1 LytR family transcriptional regulator [Clostridium sp. E14]
MDNRPSRMDNRHDRKDKNKKGKKKGKGKVIALVVGLIFLFIIAAGGTYGYLQLNKMKSAKLSKSDSDLGISDATQERLKKENADEVVNIALFGLDAREANEASRSDSMIIVSVDKKHNKIKMTSLMRDSYVNVPGHGMTKLTHAYAYGGPQLAIKTINSNFALNIKDYVTVDFFEFGKIIDAFGGVTLDIKKEEIEYMNFYIREMNGLQKSNVPEIKKTGPQNLSGLQAVAYTRIRYTSGGDFERTERQRKVLTALFNKVQEAGVTKYPGFVSALLPYVETSISKVDILKLGTTVFTNGIKTLEQERFPIDGYCNGKTIDGVWYLWTDIPATTDQIHKYIFDDVKPTPKAPLF